MPVPGGGAHVVVVVAVVVHILEAAVHVAVVQDVGGGLVGRVVLLHALQVVVLRQGVPQAVQRADGGGHVGQVAATVVGACGRRHSVSSCFVYWLVRERVRKYGARGRGHGGLWKALLSAEDYIWSVRSWPVGIIKLRVKSLLTRVGCWQEV